MNFVIGTISDITFANYGILHDKSTDIESFINLPPLHPCSGQLSINDMRLHLSNTMGSTESGKKITQAVANTGRVVGGGLSTAKGKGVLENRHTC